MSSSQINNDNDDFHAYIHILYTAIYNNRFNKDIFETINKKICLIESPIVKRTRLKIFSEMIKILPLTKLIKKFIDEGNSVVVFLTYKDSMNLLLNILERDYKDIYDKTGVINGAITKDERTINIKKFQSGDNHLMILNLKSGGTGISLHDKNNNRPRISLILPSDCFVDLKQSLGRIFRMGCRSVVIQYFICLPNNIDEKIFNNFKLHDKNLKIIMGDFMNNDENRIEDDVEDDVENILTGINDL